MRIESPHKLVAVMAETFIIGKAENRTPCSRQEDWRIKEEKRDADERKENQEAFLFQAPTRLWNRLEGVVIGQADDQHLGHVFRRDHCAKRYRCRPIQKFRLALVAFGDALAAQPKNVGQQEKEDQESIFFRDAIEADC